MAQGQVERAIAGDLERGAAAVAMAELWNSAQDGVFIREK
jgi:hypothetical protein